MTIGQTIRQYRIAKNLTQIQLAKMVGTESITVHRWETGISGVRFEYAVRCAQALGFSLDAVELAPKLPVGAQAQEESA
jgi:transcriptional regulator with XRE-family HTH domain